MTRFTKSLALFMLCLLPFAVYSQRMTVTHKVSTVQPELYPVPGSHLLEQENRKVREYIALHPEALLRVLIAENDRLELHRWRHPYLEVAEH